MNIAETIKKHCENHKTTNVLKNTCKEFAVDKTETHHGITYDFIDGSVLTIKQASWVDRGFIVVIQNKRA